MDGELIDFRSGCDRASSGAVVSDRCLEWYKVVAIELVLFASILVPLACGALMSR